MAGFIVKRIDKCKRKDGTPYKRTRWRAFIPDPDKPASSGAKIERTFSRRGDAQDWLDERKHAVKSGTYVGKNKAKTPLRDVATIWQATWGARQLRAKTQADYRSLLANHVLPTFGDTPVSAISSVDVETWLGMLAQEKGLHVATIHHAYIVLKQTMKTGVRHGYVTANPCNRDSVDLPSKRSAQRAPDEMLALEVGELRALVAAMPEHWRTPTMVAGLRGLRAGELWALRRCDVDPLHAKIHVRGGLSDVRGQIIAGPPKTPKSRRTIDMLPSMVPVMEDALANPGVRIRAVRRSPTSGPASAEGLPIRGGYPCITITDGVHVLGWTDDAQDPTRLVFTTPKGLPVRHGNLYRRDFVPTRDKLWPAGDRKHAFRWHDLRHTAATLELLSNGGNLHAVKELLGHSSIVITSDLYTHVLESMGIANAEALDRIWTASA